MEEILIIVLCDGPSMDLGVAGTVCSVSTGSGWQQWSLGNTARNVEQSLGQPDKRVVMFNDGIAIS